MHEVATALIQARNGSDTCIKLTVVATQSREEYLEVLCRGGSHGMGAT